MQCLLAVECEARWLALGLSLAWRGMTGKIEKSLPFGMIDSRQLTKQTHSVWDKHRFKLDSMFVGQVNKTMRKCSNTGFVDE
ncbi:MAG: hypothetical protein COA78_14475 [Blastopirellula sp.]|nr:MAG: hypothetical protein COA78_14475 [Blastopirellula sp.]